MEVHQRDYLPGRLWIVTKQPEKLERVLFECNIVRRPRRIWANEVSPGEFLAWPQSLPKAGEWVRAKRGLYKGDLAFVLSDSRYSDVLQIAVVPRIRYVPPPQHKVRHSEAMHPRKKQKMWSRSSRPAPAIFDPVAAMMQSNAHKQKDDKAGTQNMILKEAWSGQDLTPTRHTLSDGTPRSLHEGEIPQDICFRYNKITYIGGLLMKTVCGLEYELEHSPLKHELVPFVNSRIRPNTILPQFLSLHWKAGDKVAIYSSDIASHTTGTIVSADSAITTQTALVRVDDDSNGTCIVVELSTLHRRWKAGDGVKVIAGVNVGKYGIVLQVEEDPPCTHFLEKDSVIPVRFIVYQYRSILSLIT